MLRRAKDQRPPPTPILQVWEPAITGVVIVLRLWLADCSDSRDASLLNDLERMRNLSFLSHLQGGPLLRRLLNCWIPSDLFSTGQFDCFLYSLRPLRELLWQGRSSPKGTQSWKISGESKNLPSLQSTKPRQCQQWFLTNKERKFPRRMTHHATLGSGQSSGKEKGLAVHTTVTSLQGQKIQKEGSKILHSLKNLSLLHSIVLFFILLS